MSPSMPQGVAHTLWTDWSRTEGHYFWIRGALWGSVVTLLILLPLVRRLRRWWRSRW